MFIGSGNEIRDEVRSGRRATGFRQSRDLARWIWDHKVATFATDTFAVEVLPVVEDSDFLETAPEDSGMMHQELIAKLGVPLGSCGTLSRCSRTPSRPDAGTRCASSSRSTSSEESDRHRTLLRFGDSGARNP